MIIKLYVYFLLKTIYTKLEQIRDRGLYKYKILLHTASAQTYNPRTKRYTNIKDSYKSNVCIQHCVHLY